MAYTGTIDPTTPAGTDDASTADDQIRALKLAIKERLESLFDNINVDPLNLKSNSLNVTIGGTLYTLISMDANFKYLHHGSLPIKLPIRGPAPAADASMNNSILIDDGIGLVLYMNGLRYHLTGTAF